MLSLAKQGLAARHRLLLVTWKVRIEMGQGPRSSITNVVGIEVSLSYLLNDSAAQGHIGPTEDISHVSGYFQVILPIHAWDLESKDPTLRR